MKIKNFILSFIILFTASVASAQTSRSDFANVDDEFSQGFFEGLANSGMALYLEEWGWLKDGQLTSPQPWADKGQIWLLSKSQMAHINTDNGDCIYDAVISNGRVNLKHQKKRLANGEIVSSDPNYNGWIKILGVKMGTTQILTVDNWGVYRIFHPIDPSKLVK